MPKNGAVELADFSVVTFPYSPKDDQMYMRLCKYPNMAETPAFRMFGAWHKSTEPFKPSSLPVFFSGRVLRSKLVSLVKQQQKWKVLKACYAQLSHIP